MKRIFLPAVILGLMAIATPSYAAIYVNSETGNDANAASGCAESAPCATFAGSRSLLASDNTMYLSGIFYEQFEFYGSDSGTSDAVKTIAVWPGSEATLSYSDVVINLLSTTYITFDGLTITNSNTNGKNGIAIKNGATNVTISNSTVHDIGKRGIQIDTGSSNITIENNTIYNTVNNGINIAGSVNNVVVTGNTIHDTGGPGILSSSVVTISGNTIYNTPYAIILDDGASGSISNNVIYNSSNSSIILMNAVDSQNIYNNSFYETDLNSIFVLDPTYTGTTLNVNNNIFYLADATARIYDLLADPATEFSSDYNVFYAPNLASGEIIWAYDGEATLTEWQTRGFDTNSLVVDPLFTSTTTDVENLHLQTVSPVIDAGTTIESVTDDIDGEARPWGLAYDMGADEVIIVDTPTNLAAIATTTTADLTWDEVTGATSYNIKYGTSSDLSGTDTVETTSDTNSLALTELTYAETYYFEVQGAYSTYTSDYSAITSFTTLPIIVTKINIPKKQKKATQVTIKWKKLDGVTGYTIKLMNKKGIKLRTLNVKTNIAKKVIKKLKVGKIYKAKIRAKKKVGDITYVGAWSQAKRFTTKASK